jgi:pimeloyl-ACP methyl ester carboxylesterase
MTYSHATKMDTISEQHSSLASLSNAVDARDNAENVRRSVGRFRETRKIKMVRSVFRALSNVAPTLTAHIAYALLTKPPRSAERNWQTALRDKAHTSWLTFEAGEIAVYEWGVGPTVLMVHGWGARATHMGKMIEPLVAAGFRVVAFDAPAHGQSFGSSTDPVEFAAAVAEVAQYVGPVHTILAHSFGVAMALYAQRDWGTQAKAHVLISSFDHCKWFTDAFSNYIGLKPGVMAYARQLMVERYSGRLNWENMSVVEMLRQLNKPTLVMHDQDDGEIPFQHSVSLMQAAPHAQFHATKGLGHHRLLGDAEAIQRVVRFISNAEV